MLQSREKKAKENVVGYDESWIHLLEQEKVFFIVVYIMETSLSDIGMMC